MSCCHPAPGRIPRRQKGEGGCRGCRCELPWARAAPTLSVWPRKKRCSPVSTSRTTMTAWQGYTTAVPSGVHRAWHKGAGSLGLVLCQAPPGCWEVSFTSHSSRGRGGGRPGTYTWAHSHPGARENTLHTLHTRVTGCRCQNSWNMQAGTRTHMNRRLSSKPCLQCKKLRGGDNKKPKGPQTLRAGTQQAFS